MLYKIAYWAMVVGFGYCSCNVPNLKLKIIGLLLTVVNALLLWR